MIFSSLSPSVPSRKSFTALIATEAASLLETTLNEEKAADEKLSEVAQSINLEAAEKVLESKSR